MEQRVTGQTARLLVAALARDTGRPPTEICAELKLSPSELTDREVSYPKTQMDALWDQALHMSGDPGFGLSLSAPRSRPPTATSSSLRALFL